MSAEKELISVIVTCYNIEAVIGTCLESVLAQTYPYLEIIVVDDGSTDDSAAVCEAFARDNDGRIRVIRRENGGPGAARNTGIEAAKGELIGFVDGDDRIDPRMYEVLHGALLEYGADLAVCSVSMRVSHGDRFLDSLAERVKEPVPVTHSEKMCQREPSPLTHPQTLLLSRDELMKRLVEEDERTPIRNAVWNKLYRRELIGDVRFGTKQYYEDILFTTRVMLRAEKAVYVDQPLYSYTADRADSIMNRGVTSRILTEQIPAYMEKDRALSEAGYDDLVLTHDYLVYKKVLLLYTEARRSKDPEARRCIRDLEAFLKTAKDRFGELYGVPIADPHQRLRMQLFLKEPMLYNVFTAVNDYFVLPLRKRIGDLK